MGNTLEHQPIFINNIEPINNRENRSDNTNEIIVDSNNRNTVHPSKTKKTKTFKNPTSLKKNTLKLVKDHFKIRKKMH